MVFPRVMASLFISPWLLAPIWVVLSRQPRFDSQFSSSLSLFHKLFEIISRTLKRDPRIYLLFFFFFFLLSVIFIRSYAETVKSPCWHVLSILLTTTRFGFVHRNKVFRLYLKFLAPKNAEYKSTFKTWKNIYKTRGRLERWGSNLNYFHWLTTLR